MKQIRKINMNHVDLLFHRNHFYLVETNSISNERTKRESKFFIGVKN